MPDKSDGIGRAAPTLPLDVLVLILSNVPKSDTATLSAFLRSSNQCYSAAAPLLYRHVRFGSPTNHHPFVDMQQSTIKSRQASTVFRPGQGRPPPKLPSTRKKDLLKFVRTLSIEMHSDWWCDGLPEQSFPNLHTLRLDFSREIPNLIHTSDQLQSCVTFRTVSPKRLVLRRLQPWPGLSPPFAPYADLIQRTTDDLAFVFENSPPLRRSNYQVFLRDLLFPLPKCPAEWVAIIFCTKSPHIRYPQNRFLPSSQSLRGFDSSCELWRDLAGNIIFAFAKWVTAEPRHLVMVNTGSFSTTQMASTDTTEEAVQAAVEQQLKDGILNNTSGDGLKRKEVEERLKMVEFMTMKKYLEETDWAGVFDENEVKPWFHVSEAEG